MLFLVIISWKVVSCFNEAGGVVFQIGGGFILSGVAPHGGASVVVGGFSKKIVRLGGTPPR